MVGPERAGAIEDGDLALLEQPSQATDQLIDDRLLAFDRAAPVQTLELGLDPEGLGVIDGPTNGGGLEQLLGRDAPDVETRASELVTLDQGDVESGRRSIERRGVPSGPASDHNDVEMLTGQLNHLRLRVKSTASLPRSTATRRALLGASIHAVVSGVRTAT